MNFPHASKSFQEANPHIFGDITTHGQEQPTKSAHTGASGTAGAGPVGQSKQEAKLEKELQNQIAGFLERNGIVVIRSRTDKKTSTNVGTPDLLFAVRNKAIAFEIKMPGEKPTKEQRDMMEKMDANGTGWLCRVVDSYDQAVEIFEKLSA